MTKTFFGFLAIFGLTYLAYVVWLTGYRRGYEDGSDQAWSTARQSFVPKFSRPDERDDSPRIVPVKNVVKRSNADSL